MGAKSERLFRLRAKAGNLPNVSTATPDFSTGTVHEIRANQDIEFTLGRPRLPDNRVVSWLHDVPTPKLGLQSWSLTWTQYLTSHGQTTGTATVYDQDTDSLGFLLAKGLGGQTIAGTGANSDVASGSATTGFVVTAGHGARFLAGQAYAINPNGLGYLEAREVLSRSTDTLTCKVVHSQAMTTGDDVIGGQTTYAPQATALSEGVHFIGIGHDANDQVIFANGRLTGFALTCKTGQLPTIKWTWTGVGFLRTTGQTFLGQTFNGGACAAVKDSELLISSIAGTTRVLQHAPDFNYSFSLNRASWGSPSGIEGELEPVHLGFGVSADITLPFDSARSTPYTWVYATGGEAETRYQWFHQFGRTAGNTVLVSLPTLFVADEPQRVKMGGMVCVKTQFTGTIDGAISSPTTDLGNANARIHRL